jgi:DnaK suppressor protein
MKKSELGRFRGTLKAIQLELSGGRHKREALAIETSPEELDQIQQAQERDSAMEALNRECVRLREVRTALDRMDRGRFGTCLNCQKDISAKRLAAVPLDSSLYHLPGSRGRHNRRPWGRAPRLAHQRRIKVTFNQYDSREGEPQGSKREPIPAALSRVNVDRYL